MFPGPGAQVYRNEAGEVLGWDYPSDEPPDLDEWYEHNYEMDEDEDEDEDDKEPSSKDAETLALADDVEHFYAEHAWHLSPEERALLANAVKLIRAAA